MPPDKYIHNITYPTTFEDIERFEIDNQVSVSAQYISDDDAFRTEKRGNPDYVLNDVICLLRIAADNHAHYIYIKHLERLLHTHVSSKTPGTKLCPLCEENIDEKEYRAHLTQCQKYGKEGTLMKMPAEGATMKFTKFKHKLQRPFIVYADQITKTTSTTTFQILAV